MTGLKVYLPQPGTGTAQIIDPGSGIVGSLVEGLEPLRLMLDFEGNRYGAVNLVTYADRVYHAAGRHVTRYPTVARAWVRPEEVVCIGWWDDTTGRVQLVLADHDDALARWLGVDSVPAHELLARGARWGR